MGNIKRPVKVALHAMDERSVRTMTMYLQGPCKGVAMVVDDASADCDIYDGDNIHAKKLLADRLNSSSTRQVIVLSLNSVKLNNVIVVKKPVKSEDMLGALAEVKARLERDAKQEEDLQPTAIVTPLKKLEENKPILKHFRINSGEQSKISKHQTAMQINEASFNAYIGSLPGLDVNDPAQFFKASYNPNEYFQGYIQSAIKTCQKRDEILQLSTNWRQLILFPHNHELWLDADDKQLRAFAGVKIEKTIGSKMLLTPCKYDPAALANASDKFHTIETFVWKLACWTSKGRYPNTLDIEHPVYLKNWPNFTRLLITPHAMRIAALMVHEPRTLSDVARILNIKPQYVFVFISAACAIGLVGQARREADVLVKAPEIKPSQKQGLLGRIISKLRGSNV